MSKRSVEITGILTSDIPMLSYEETKKLFIDLKNGDKFAREKLIEGNLRLVLSILRKFNGRVDNMDDLFQVGCIGLVKAIDNFDISYDVKLSTYAVPMILGEVKRYLRDNNSVRVARSIKDLSYKISLFKENYFLIHGFEPTLEILCNEFQMPEYEIVLALDSNKQSISMYEPIYNDGGDVIYLFDQLEDKKDTYYSIEDKMSVKEAFKDLSSKEDYIIKSRYLVGKTQVELSEELGISQAQISRLEKKGMKVLKKTLK